MTCGVVVWCDRGQLVPARGRLTFHPPLRACVRWVWVLGQANGKGGEVVKLQENLRVAQQEIKRLTEQERKREKD